MVNLWTEDGELKILMKDYETRNKAAHPRGKQAALGTKAQYTKGQPEKGLLQDFPSMAQSSGFLPHLAHHCI